MVILDRFRLVEVEYRDGKTTKLAALAFRGFTGKQEDDKFDINKHLLNVLTCVISFHQACEDAIKGKMVLITVTQLIHSIMNLVQ